MSAETAAYCRERLIRLKPGLLSGDIWINFSMFISRLDACRGRHLLKGKPDPAEAGTPDLSGLTLQRSSGAPDDLTPPEGVPTNLPVLDGQHS